MYDVIHVINIFTCCARLAPRTALRRRETPQVSDIHGSPSTPADSIILANHRIPHYSL